MMQTKLIHPGILGALSLCGHGDKVLIADGNYPLDSESGNAKKVYLGLMPGVPNVTDVLEAFLDVVTVEKAEVMQPEDGATPAIFVEFSRLLGGMNLEKRDRQDFYRICAEPKIRLAISTGEQRVYANILLTIGVARGFDTMNKIRE